jgi:methylglyoxal synthase
VTKKALALIAHDNCKEDMVAWCRANKDTLSRYSLWATGTTGTVVSRETGLEVTRVASGPMGGDLQIGCKIVEGEIDVMIFFWDPLTAQPHDPDVKALLRVAVLKNIPVANNQVTADFIISSPLLDGR